jgi:hypothetical protein
MMNILTKAIVLVLNRNWQAINVRTPQEAFCMMATNVATALEIEVEAPAELPLPVGRGEGRGEGSGDRRDTEGLPLGTPHSTLAPRVIRPVSWEEWITLPVRDRDQAVHTVRGQIRVPTVIVAVNFARVPKKRPKLSAKTIRERDPDTSGLPVHRLIAASRRRQP